MQRVSPVMENSHGSRRCFRPLGSGFSVVLGSVVLPARERRVYGVRQRGGDGDSYGDGERKRRKI